MATLREISKQDLSSKMGITFESISAGALQRIADATELMAENNAQTQRELLFYKTNYPKKMKEIVHLKNQISALKGVITKLKKK